MATQRIIAHLTNPHASVVLQSDGGMPEIVYWGRPLASTPDPDIFVRPIVGGGLDVDPPVGILAEASRGWFGRPGLQVFRAGGRDAAPRFALVDSNVGERHADFELSDDVAQIGATVSLELSPAGLLRAQATVHNRADEALTVAGCGITVPVPDRAAEALTVGGRHTFEFVTQRHRWVDTAIAVENRHGKTSHERLGVVMVGTDGFTDETGEVWSCHIGWSGNYEIYCDALTDARHTIYAGELLLAGEIELTPGARYQTPPIYYAYSHTGLNGISARHHDHLRQRSHHPRLPRPVHLNTWEAVYFDHDLDTLRNLATAAAEVGVERFVLDDGWFGGRRDDHRGLGDWWVSFDAWPDGLEPLIDHVTDLGMEFGIWVEPEMVNPDSDLYRAHPDWALIDQRYPPVLGRNQLVLDLARPEVVDYLFEHLDHLLSNHRISYIKWDHNRDLVAPTSDGAVAAHRQTLGAYELFDRLRAAHPDVEIETCASGGGRVDFGILERTDRVWTSDSNDALDRNLIQRGFSLLFPPELMGSHIGAPTSHTTMRTQRLSMRGAVALFGAFGIEWDLLATDADERAQLAALVEMYKRWRGLLHTGRSLRLDTPDPTIIANAVVASAADRALVSVTRTGSGPSHHTDSIRVPHLDPTTRFQVRLVDELGEPLGHARVQPGWVSDGMIVSGEHLAAIGIQPPQLFPENTALIEVTALDQAAAAPTQLTRVET